MDNYICKIATLKDIIKKYDYDIINSVNEGINLIQWKKEAIEEFNKGSSIAYMGLLNGKIISACYAALTKTNVQNSDGLVNDKTAYLFGFKTNKEYQGQGYFSILFKFMINDLISRGYEKVTLGVEPNAKKNKAIYFKYGFTEHIKDGKEVYPDGSIINVEYYGKKLKKESETMSNLEEIKQIFNNNKDKRICVLGTTCTGKSTLISKSNIGVDIDSEIYPNLTKEEIEYFDNTPWTIEVGNKMDELVRSRLNIKPGVPMFGTVLLDCDLIVYLHINDELLLKRTKSRNVDFNNAKNMQQAIEEEIKNSNIPVITIEVKE